MDIQQDDKMMMRMGRVCSVGENLEILYIPFLSPYSQRACLLITKKLNKTPQKHSMKCHKNTQ